MYCILRDIDCIKVEIRYIVAALVLPTCWNVVSLANLIHRPNMIYFWKFLYGIEWWNYIYKNKTSKKEPRIKIKIKNKDQVEIPIRKRVKLYFSRNEREKKKKKTSPPVTNRAININTHHSTRKRTYERL